MSNETSTWISDNNLVELRWLHVTAPSLFEALNLLNAEIYRADVEQWVADLRLEISDDDAVIVSALCEIPRTR